MVWKETKHWCVGTRNMFKTSIRIYRPSQDPWNPATGSGFGAFEYAVGRAVSGSQTL